MNSNILVAVFVLAGSVWGAALLDLGSRRELFVDRVLLHELRGDSLKLHTPQLAPPVSPPRPNGHYGTVLRDGRRLPVLLPRRQGACTAGRPVRLRFAVADADLFSLKFN